MSSMNQLTVGFPIASSKVYRGMHWNLSETKTKTQTFFCFYKMCLLHEFIIEIKVKTISFLFLPLRNILMT